ncbi:MAG: nickel pincer cofactor biosynthesis protein LarC [Candidatus Saganbacteria bacterium]|nr:nickel pincer cofactor biosynthesis protein LarC [Candidatus Saganbacteria bacterium]
MRTAYFDCSSGIAGNMIIGALLDAGLDPAYLKKELNKLRVSHYTLRITRKNKLAGTYFDVALKSKEPQRNLKGILKIISASRLSKDVKELSSRIFKRLAQAEAKVHGITVNKVHFHEVGAIDAIVDIVGACIGLEKLGIEQVVCSPIPFGTGRIKHAHGLLPIPAPATAELLKGVPIYQLDVKGELTTPTGAAIITTITDRFGLAPRLELEASGSGQGSKKYPGLPNTFRIHIGEALDLSATDAVVQIEANIDDMAPGSFNQVIKELMKAGALDAYMIQVMMKKQRQALQLVALCRPEDRHLIITRIFELTTTFGVRVFLVPREKLARHFKTVKTKYGQARVKIGSLGSRRVTVAPEFEDYKRLARKHNVPIQQVYKEIKRCL